MVIEVYLNLKILQADEYGSLLILMTYIIYRNLQNSIVCTLYYMFTSILNLKRLFFSFADIMDSDSCKRIKLEPIIENVNSSLFLTAHELVEIKLEQCDNVNSPSILTDELTNIPKVFKSEPEININDEKTVFANVSTY